MSGRIPATLDIVDRLWLAALKRDKIRRVRLVERWKQKRFFAPAKHVEVVHAELLYGENIVKIKSKEIDITLIGTVKAELEVKHTRTAIIFKVGETELQIWQMETGPYRIEIRSPSLTLRSNDMMGPVIDHKEIIKIYRRFTTALNL